MPANDQFWRPLSTMHKVFAVSALVLLAATYLMMAKDHRDEWRQYQVTADQLKADQLSQQLSAVQSPAYEARKAELEQQEKDAQAALDEQSADIAKQKEAVTQIQGEVDLLARETKFLRKLRRIRRQKEPKVIYRRSVGVFHVVAFDRLVVGDACQFSETEIPIDPS